MGGQSSKQAKNSPAVTSRKSHNSSDVIREDYKAKALSESDAMSDADEGTHDLKHSVRIYYLYSIRNQMPLKF